MMTETRCRFERRETRSSVGLQGFPMAGLPRIRAGRGSIPRRAVGCWY
jgi:hypothetical protein